MLLLQEESTTGGDSPAPFIGVRGYSGSVRWLILLFFFHKSGCTSALSDFAVKKRDNTHIKELPVEAAPLFMMLQLAANALRRF